MHHHLGAGLVEGVWPPDPRNDPWLNRPMRQQLGLDLPERRIGLSAHDFAQALGTQDAIITRARKRLYLSFSQTRMLHGQTRYHIKSRFFDELPETALKWITPRNQGFGSGFARDYQSAARAMASARTTRPSASVLVISAFLPLRNVTTSAGR